MNVCIYNIFVKIFSISLKGYGLGEALGVEAEREEHLRMNFTKPVEGDIKSKRKIKRKLRFKSKSSRRGDAEFLSPFGRLQYPFSIGKGGNYEIYRKVGRVWEKDLEKAIRNSRI